MPWDVHLKAYCSKGADKLAIAIRNVPSSMNKQEGRFGRSHDELRQ